jgi:hypothetical protein
MVTHVVVICLDRSGNHATISFINNNTTWRHTQGICTATAARPTAWCNVYWYCGVGLGPWSTSVSKFMNTTYRRYFTSQYWMTKGKFPASRGAVLLLSFIGAAVYCSGKRANE